MGDSVRLISAIVLASGIAAGGFFAGEGLLKARQLDRSVTVKGLAEEEHAANIAIWPIRFVRPGNDLQELVAALEADAEQVRKLLLAYGFDAAELTVNPPDIVDKQANNYGNSESRFRYSATGLVTVYTTKVETVREAKSLLGDLGKQGVTVSANEYQSRAEYIFTGLNDVKPGMVEQATKNARAVAEKFAADSNSTLGKIKSARQGQFSISDRDSNTPHVKKVRIVSTLEYYLAD